MKTNKKAEAKNLNNSKSTIVVKKEAKEAKVTKEAKKDQAKVEVKKEKKEKAPRTLKYQYPADCTDSLARKQFRSKQRALARKAKKEAEKANENPVKVEKKGKSTKKHDKKSPKIAVMTA